MNGDAGQLSAAAQSLRDAGRPCRAVILDVLAALPTDHLAAIIESRDFSEDIVRAMAERTGHHLLAVADVMRKFAQFDCAGYQAKYECLAAEYRSIIASGVPTPGLGWREGDGLIRFLLHDTLCCWDGRESRLKEVVIEDNQRYLMVRGHLIDRQLAFPTMLELLRVSCQQDWPNWRSLWTYF